MKDFIKVVLAVICGVFIAGIIGFFLFFGMLGSLASSSKPMMPREGVLKIDLNKFVLGEQTRSADPLGSLDPMSLLTGRSTSAKTLGIWDAMQAIDAAAEDPAVKYIYTSPSSTVSSTTAWSPAGL